MKTGNSKLAKFSEVVTGVILDPVKKETNVIDKTKRLYLNAVHTLEKK